MNKFFTTNNLGWKILSVIMAIALWLYVINDVDPVRTQTLNNIPIQVRNEETITSKNKFINYPSDMSVDVTIQGRRSIVDKLKASDVIVIADMNKYQEITNTVPLLPYTDRDNDIIDSKVKPGSVKVTIEDIITKQFDIKVNVAGQPLDEFVSNRPVLQPNSVELTGPESKMAMVEGVYADVDITGKKENQTLSRDIRVLDAKGKEVPNVTPSMQQVSVAIEIMKTKSVPLRIDVDGPPPNGYLYLDDLTIEPNEIIIQGPEEVIDSVTEVVLPNVDITTTTSSKKEFKNISDSLPENIFLAEGEPKNAAINITLHPLEVRDIVIPLSAIKVYNLKDNMNVQILTEENAKLSFKGLKTDLDEKLRLNELIVSINVAGLDVGNHELPIQVYSPRGLELVSDGTTLQIDLKELEVVPTEADLAEAPAEGEVAVSEEVNEPTEPVEEPPVEEDTNTGDQEGNTDNL